MRLVTFLGIALSIGCVVVGPPGCASAGPPVEPTLTRGDSRTITSSDLAGAVQLSLLDFLEAERPRWIRGADGRLLAVSVYLNGAAVGGPGALRDISLSQVAGARFYDVAAAQQRFSTRVVGPVIAVTLR